ncbi:MAG: hypothetical protein J5781_02610, partial [Clostridia bacterium]|nr:hypothetical protein [Clostridia bacterium]
MKRKLFLKLAAIGLVVVMLMALTACFNNNKNNIEKHEDQNELTPDAIKALNDLADYSKSAADWNAAGKGYTSGNTYDGKDCSAQIAKLQRRIDKKTEDIYFGKSESAVTKIFTKSTPEGILKAISDAALTYDEMVRVVDYIAGDEDANVDSFVKEIKDEVNGEEVTTGWTGKLTTTSSSITLWKDAGENGEDLNKGWSFFDDWELYDRLKEYTKSKDTNGLVESNKDKLNDIGTKELSGDNASWQYRSILEKVYTQVNLPGASAARLATYMLNYAIEITEGMSHGEMTAAATDTNNSTPYSAYFKNKVTLPKNIPTDNLDSAKAVWQASGHDPYDGLGDYDVLVYLLAFNDFYTKGYASQKGVQPCAKLYGYYYLYNQTYYNVVLADRPTYTKQLRYEKLDTFSDSDWLDYVDIQRKNYTGSYRYSDAFYQTFYGIHFDFQGRKENFEERVYDIPNVINNRTYTGEMQKAISTGNNGIKGQLAMSDWTWCYGGSEENMKSYNKANTGYQEGKNKSKLGTGTKEGEYEGQFNYEFEELKVAHYLLSHMTEKELSGALYYNCYAYSGSLISEMQNYSKDIVLITDNIKDYTEFTTVSESAGVRATDKAAYAKEKLAVLRNQAKDDWTNTGVDGKAGNVK